VFVEKMALSFRILANGVWIALVAAVTGRRVAATAAHVVTHLILDPRGTRRLPTYSPLWNVTLRLSWVVLRPRPFCRDRERRTFPSPQGLTRVR
jgi:hypothetical protein